MRALPPLVVRIADATHGTVSRRRLIGLGIPSWQIDGWLRCGLVECTDQRGVLRVAGSGRPPEQLLWAAVRRAGPGARVAGLLACALYGLDGCVWTPGDEIDHIAVPPARRVRGVDFVVVRTPLPDGDCADIDGLPGVTVERALVGLAGTHHPARVLTAFDSARRRRLTDEEAVGACARALGRAHGAAEMRTIVASRALRMESPGERRLAGIFRAGDPPLAEQVWVQWRARWYRLDFAYPEARLAVEYDGDNHDERREQDADRDLALSELDIATARVTKSMMRDPAETRRRLLAVRARRIALALPPIVRATPPWLGARTIDLPHGGRASELGGGARTSDERRPCGG